MSKLTKHEEDYLKALFYLTVELDTNEAGTNQLAEHLEVTPASVSNMLKKLRGKELVSYEKYGKLQLTNKGREIATLMVRKHRLWETFLQGHLNFTWDEVHEVAEQLEHVKSEKLIAELDKFLGHPARDPHGAVIPLASGEYLRPVRTKLSSVEPGTNVRIVSVKDSSSEFLQYLSRIGLQLGSEFRVIERLEFDDSMMINIDATSRMVSRKFADRVFVEELTIETKD